MEKKNRTEKRGHIYVRKVPRAQNRARQSGSSIPVPLELCNRQHSSPEGWICSSKDGARQLRVLCFSCADLQVGSKESKSCSCEDLKITKHVLEGIHT